MKRYTAKLTLGFAALSMMGLLLLAVEAGVRIANVDAVEWPSYEASKPAFIEIDPLLGARPRPGYTGPWWNFQVTIDEFGFRSTGFPPLDSPEKRIAFLGDSCTFGWGLADRETFAGRLDGIQRERKINRYAIRNAGYPGDSAVIGPHVFRESVKNWEPDIVVLGYSANNAFRFSAVSDRERLARFGIRALLLKSQAYRAAASRFAVAAHTPREPPRTRGPLLKMPIQRVRRIATLPEFEQSILETIRLVRASGAEPLLMVLPRSMEIEPPGPIVEDVAVSLSNLGFGPNHNLHHTASREFGLLELSCLDHNTFTDPIAALREKAPDWVPVRPKEAEVLGLLREGARALNAGQLVEAERLFSQAVALAPTSPLAHYDLGIAKIARGNQEEGLAALDKAETLACNVFLTYQVSLRRIAIEEDVAVVDIIPIFQAQKDSRLFLDFAHPNKVGNELIAEALLSHLGTM